MRNTLILIGQIKTNQEEGLDSYHAVIEATVQRSRPVILTALAAVLAFIPLTFSVFWGSLAYTLIGGAAAGKGLSPGFFPAPSSLFCCLKTGQWTAPNQNTSTRSPFAAQPPTNLTRARVGTPPRA